MCLHRNFLISMVAVSAATLPATGYPACDARSGSKTAALVELYTSEGCSSCPPADRQLSQLRQAVDPAAEVVPLALHVGYWDYIGWKDRFARPAYAQRQRDAVARQGSRTSYTPQVMLDGRDLRGWSDTLQFQSRLREISIRAPRATVSLETRFAGNAVEATLHATVARPEDWADASVFIAITENNLGSRVTAGENKGVLLKHDHVVRELIGPLAVDSRDRAVGNFPIRQNLALAPDWKPSDLSLVAFVQNSRTGQILQALSTPLCRGQAVASRAKDSGERIAPASHSM